MYPEYGLTCANHDEEIIMLIQIGWMSFKCPVCEVLDIEYSIGRKIVIPEMIAELLVTNPK